MRRPELADEQICALAPSVFAASPLPDVSQRYLRWKQFADEEARKNPELF